MFCVIVWRFYFGQSHYGEIMTTFLGSAYFLWSEKTPVLAQIALRALNLLIKNHRGQYYKQHRSERKCTDCRRKPKFFIFQWFQRMFFLTAEIGGIFTFMVFLFNASTHILWRRNVMSLQVGFLIAISDWRKLVFRVFLRYHQIRFLFFVKIFLISIVLGNNILSNSWTNSLKKNTLGKLSESTYSYCFQ